MAGRDPMSFASSAYAEVSYYREPNSKRTNSLSNISITSKLINFQGVGGFLRNRFLLGNIRRGAFLRVGRTFLGWICGAEEQKKLAGNLTRREVYSA